MPELALLGSNPRGVIFEELGMRPPFLKGYYLLDNVQCTWAE